MYEKTNIMPDISESSKRNVRAVKLVFCNFLHLATKQPEPSVFLIAISSIFNLTTSGPQNAN